MSRFARSIFVCTFSSVYLEITFWFLRHRCSLHAGGRRQRVPSEALLSRVPEEPAPLLAMLLDFLGRPGVFEYIITFKKESLHEKDFC